MKRLGWSPVIVVVLVGLSGCTGGQGPVVADCTPGYQHPEHDTSRCVQKAAVRLQPNVPVVSQTPPLPTDLFRACGHPRARVALRAVPVNVSATRCDLTGVECTYLGLTVTVPVKGSATQIAHADGPIGSQTTTMTATQEQGNISLTVTSVKG